MREIKQLSTICVEEGVRDWHNTKIRPLKKIEDIEMITAAIRSQRQQRRHRHQLTTKQQSL